MKSILRLPYSSQSWQALGVQAVLKAKMILMELLLKVNSAFHKTSQYAKIHTVLSDIITHPGEKHSIRKMAERCHYSTDQFRRIFLSITGVLPQAYIEGIRMQHAAELLTATNEDIESIAKKLGFEDRFYFSRRFKKFFHIPPAAYRQKNEVKK